jgi:hypothetical protein
VKLPRLTLAPLLLVLACWAGHSHARERWTPEKANAWYQGKPWLVGCNYIPSTAINQLEMWQADTFDPETIDRELGWAERLGFNSVRVFLHNLLWEQDREGFLRRLERFLQIADRHHIGVIFVLFDSVWDPFPRLGKQREPQPHLHNSGWVQSPGVEVLRDPAKVEALRPYVTGVVGRFRKDRRVHAWDLVNEPDNSNRSSYRRYEPKNKGELGLRLLEKSFAWARSADPEQPLTAGLWVGHWADPGKLTLVEKACLDESDVISFHCYGRPTAMRRCVRNLRRYGRPLLCTEFMARGKGSTFHPILRYLQRQKVAAYCWGFVGGKTQTIYPWDSWRKAYIREPQVWFHDILRKDGTPYDPKEVSYIQRVTGKAKPLAPSRTPDRARG